MHLPNELFEIPSEDGILMARISEDPKVIRDQDLPLVILATGDGVNGSKGQTWQQLVPMLKKEGLPSLLFDFTGLGYSDGVYEDLNLSRGCRNLEAVLRYVVHNDLVGAVGIGILGASYGGNVALLVAAEHPEVRALALKSPSSFLPEGYQLQYGDELMAEWGRRGFHPTVGLKYEAVIDSLMHNTYYAAAQIEVPVRIVQGDSDTAVPIRHSRDLVRVMSNATLLELPGVDHWYQEGDSWNVMAEDLISFLKKALVR